MKLFIFFIISLISCAYIYNYDDEYEVERLPHFQAAKSKAKVNWETVSKEKKQIIAQSQNTATASQRSHKMPTKAGGVPVQYSEAFIQKHNGSPDRGPHSGSTNTVISRPQDIKWSKPQPVMEDGQHKIDPVTGHARYTITSKDKVQAQTYQKSDGAWSPNPNHPENYGHITVEGSMIPSGAIRVDHLHPPKYYVEDDSTDFENFDSDEEEFDFDDEFDE